MNRYLIWRIIKYDWKKIWILNKSMIKYYKIYFSFVNDMFFVFKNKLRIKVII